MDGIVYLDELYIGRLVHGRREYRINPRTGLRGKAVMKPVGALKIKKEAPHLRIIPPGDALLQVVGNLGEMLTAVGVPREATVVGNSNS
jgi:hypothetical protein